MSLVGQEDQGVLLLVGRRGLLGKSFFFRGDGLCLFGGCLYDRLFDRFFDRHTGIRGRYWNRLRSLLHRTHDGALATSGLQKADGHGGEDEADEARHGHLVQNGGGAARSEGGLRTATSEDRKIRTLALLEKDDEDQEQTNDDVDRIENVNHKYYLPGSRI